MKKPLERGGRPITFGFGIVASGVHGVELAVFPLAGALSRRRDNLTKRNASKEDVDAGHIERRRKGLEPNRF